VEALKRRLLTIAHDTHGLLVPVEIRPHVCAALASGLAHKAGLDIGQPDIIGQAFLLVAIE
jgi:hypothetical protein